MQSQYFSVCNDNNYTVCDAFEQSLQGSSSCKTGGRKVGVVR